MNNNSTSDSTSNSLSPPIAFIALVMGSIAMGVSPVFVRYSEVGPFASAFWRVFLAFPVLYIWVMLEYRNEKQKFQITFPAPILWAGLFFAGDLTFWHLAITNTTMANATLMACLAPVWVVIFSGTFIGEPVGRNSYLGLILCLVGAAMLVGSSYSIDPSRIRGDIYGLITSLFFGLYFLAVRVARRTVKGGALTFTSTIVTATYLLLIAIIATRFGNQQFFPTTSNGVTALLMLGTISHAGGQGLLAVALGSLSAVFSSLVIFIEAIAGAFFGWLAFDEQLSPTQITGGIAILVGIWIARPKK